MTAVRTDGGKATLDAAIESRMGVLRVANSTARIGKLIWTPASLAHAQARPGQARPGQGQGQGQGTDPGRGDRRKFILSRLLLLESMWMERDIPGREGKRNFRFGPTAREWLPRRSCRAHSAAA